MIELSDNDSKQHPLILSEGMPITKLLKPREKRYFSFNVDDDSIEKVSIQLTTIHGDPDIYVTIDGSEPSYSNFFRRSVNQGIFPDIIVFGKNRLMPSMKHNYRVMVSATSESTFSLEYFTNTKNGSIGIQKLLVGKAQRGVIHPNMTIKDFFDQPAHIYHFQVPAALLRGEHS